MFQNYDLNVATVHVFVTRFVQVAYHLFDGEDRLPVLANYLAELSLLDHEMLKYSYSTIAISCIVLSLHCFKRCHWNTTLEFYSGHKFTGITDCIKRLHQVWKCQPHSKLNVIWRKYSRREYLRVAALHPRLELS